MEDLKKDLAGDLSKILKTIRDSKISADEKRNATNKVIDIFSTLGIDQSEEDKRVIAEIMYKK